MRLHFLTPLKECVDPIPGLLDGADGGGGHCLPTTVSCKERVLYSGVFVVLTAARSLPDTSDSVSVLRQEAKAVLRSVVVRPGDTSHSGLYAALF